MGLTDRLTAGGGNRTCVKLYSAGVTDDLPTVDMSGYAPEGGSAGDFAAGIMFFDANEGSPITGDVSIDTFELELNNKARDTYWDQFKADCVRNIQISKAELTCEDSVYATKITFPTNGVLIVGVHADGVVGATATRLLTGFVGFVDPSVLGSTRAAGAFGDANVKFVGYPAPTTTIISVADLTAMFSDMVSVGALTTITIAPGVIGAELRVAIA